MDLKQITMADLGVSFTPEPGKRNPRRFMNWGEPETLLALAKMSPGQIFVEIGVNDGLTAQYLLYSMPSIKWYLGIDVLPGYVTSKNVQRREVPAMPGHMAQNDQRFSLTLRTNGSLDLHYTDLPKSVDFVFIDGDHGSAAVEHDTMLAAHVLKDNGLVVWHDYHHLGTVDVAAVLEDLDAGCGTIKHIKDTWLAFTTGASLRTQLMIRGGWSHPSGPGTPLLSSAAGLPFRASTPSASGGEGE